MALDYKNPIPLYLQIIEDIQENILKGVYKPNTPLPSLTELCKMYDAGRSTIHRALQTLISSGKIYSRVGKGLYVNDSHPLTPFPKLKNIIVVTNSLTNVTNTYISGFEQAAKEYECYLHILLAQEERGNHDVMLKNILSLDSKTIVFLNGIRTSEDQALVDMMFEAGLTLVSPYYTQDKRIIFIGVNPETIGKMATNHLIKLGYQRIGYVGPMSEESQPSHKLKLRGYKSALSENNLNFNPNLVINLSNLQITGNKKDIPIYQEKLNAYINQAIKNEQINLENRPDAIFAYNDFIAFALIEVLRKHNYYVPKDIAIVGDGDYESMSHLTSGFLTSVHRPVLSIARESIRYILGKKTISKKSGPKNIYLTPQVVIRESCGSLSFDTENI